MRILTSISAAATCILFVLAPASSQTLDKSVIGQWKLMKVLDSSEITALDDEQANKLVGQVFVIQANKVQFAGRICQDPNFEMTQAETYEYFARNANASADNLGLPNPVTAIHVDCTYVYKKAPDKVVVHWKGFFFDAVRLR